MGKEINGYMDEDFEPVFVINESLPTSIRRLGRFSMDDDEDFYGITAGNEDTPSKHSALDYIKSSHPYKRDQLHYHRDADGKVERITLEQKEHRPSHIPVYICNSRIGLGRYRSLSRQTHHRSYDHKSKEWVDMGIDDGEGEDMIFKMDHDVSWEWLKKVGNDKIEI
jgi:hypothetical protein